MSGEERRPCDHCSEPSTCNVVGGFVSCSRCLAWFVAQYDEVPLKVARAAIRDAKVVEHIDGDDEGDLHFSTGGQR